MLTFLCLMSCIELTDKCTFYDYVPGLCKFLICFYDRTQN